MNNKGFTLIELLVTIVLLATIALISFVSINRVIERNKVNNCESLRNEIKSAVKEYISDNRYNSDFTNLISNLQTDTLTILKNNNYLKYDTIKNPFTNEEITSITTNVTLSPTGREVTSVDITSPTILETCVYAP